MKPRTLPCLLLALTLLPTIAQARIDRFSAIQPGAIYRGSVPYPEDYDSLKRLGIKTIIDLMDTDEGADDEAALAAKAGIGHIHAPFEWESREIDYTPSTEETALARQFAANPPPGFANAIAQVLKMLDHPGTPLTVEFPKAATIDHILALASDPALQPVYIHCVMGRDRTGFVSAQLRIQRQGWSPDRAYQEMQAFDFKPGIIMEGLHQALFNTSRSSQ